MVILRYFFNLNEIARAERKFKRKLFYTNTPRHPSQEGNNRSFLLNFRTRGFIENFELNYTINSPLERTCLPSGRDSKVCYF